MRLITLFLHVLSTGFLLSFLSSSPVFLLASATPMLVPRGRRTLQPHPSTYMDLTSDKPEIGSLIWAIASKIKCDTGLLSASAPDNAIAAVLVTEVPIEGEKYKGIAFVQGLAKTATVNTEFFRNSLPVTDALRLIPGFEVYKGYVQVSNKDVKVDPPYMHKNLLDAFGTDILAKKFEKLLGSLLSLQTA